MDKIEKYNAQYTLTSARRNSTGTVDEVKYPYIYNRTD